MPLTLTHSPERLCHNVILRREPKNLCFPTHRFYEILRGVYPERCDEILRSAPNDMRRAQNDMRRAQNDKRRVQNDKHGISLIMTQSLRVEGTTIILLSSQELHELDEVAYVRFASVYRSFKDISEFMAEVKTLLGSKR